MVNRAFTLIELLTAMVVIAVLAGVILAVVPLIKRRSEVTRTLTILELLRNGLNARSVDRGGLPSPVPHPLAGSNGAVTPRSLFVRASDGTTAIDTTGEALEAGQLAWVAAASRSKVLLPDDRFSGRYAIGDVPALFGLPRYRLALLGAAGELYKRQRRLPELRGSWDANGDGILDPPYDGTKYPNRTCLMSGGVSFTITAGGTGYGRPPIVTLTSGNGMTATATVHGGSVTALVQGGFADPALTAAPTVAFAPASGDPGSGAAANASLHDDTAADAVLGSVLGDHLAELAGLGALAKPGGSRCADDLLASDGSPDPAWRTRSIRLAGAWQRYRIRGQALYDVWGGEILCWNDPTSRALWVGSAGPDGYFVLKPDASGGYTAADLDPSLVPGTRDATRDNLQLEVGR